MWLAIFLALAPPVAQEPWPSFRGPGGAAWARGVSLAEDFDPDTHRAWRTAAPSGFSSPILAGDLLVLAGSHQGRPVLVALDAATGELRWRRWVSRENIAPSKGVTPESRAPALAPSTPATDGETIVAFFPHLGLFAVGLDGGLRWEHPMGPHLQPFPLASSPVIADGVVVQLIVSTGAGEVLALDLASGDVLWSEPWQSSHMSHSTPLVTEDRIVVSGSLRAAALDRSTGEPLWSHLGTAWQARPMPVRAGEVLLLLSAMPAAGLEGRDRIDLDWAQASERWDADGSGSIERDEHDAEAVGEKFGFFDADKSGAIEETEWESFAAWSRSENGLLALSPDGELLWKERRGVPFNTSPLVVDDRVVLFRDGGLVTVREIATGELQESLRVDALSGEAYASPIRVGDELLLCSVDGGVAVLRPEGDTYGVSQSWQLDEQLYATPAVGRGHVFVRTLDAVHAYRLAGTPAPPVQAFVDVGVLAPDGASVIEAQTVLVQGGHLTVIGPRDGVEVPARATNIPTEPGHVLVPGLIDLWAEIEDDGELGLHLSAGVTHIRTVDGRADHLEWRRRVRAGEHTGPRWEIGAPTIPDGRVKRRDAEERRFYVPTPAADGAAAAVERSLAEGYDFASTDVGMHRARWLAAARRAAELGVPLAGPPAFPAALAADLPAWTFDRAEVFYGPWERRAAITEPLDPARVARQIARRGIPVTPLLAAYRSAQAALEDLYELPPKPELSAVGRLLWQRNAHAARRHLLPEQVDRMQGVTSWQDQLVTELHRAGVVLLAGSDALAPGVLPGQGLHAELRALAACELSPAEVLRAATAAPAAVLGSRAGVLEEGRPADVILVAGDPLRDLGVLSRPAGVMVGGRWYSREWLDTQDLARERIDHLEHEFVQKVLACPPEELDAFLGQPAPIRAHTVKRVIEILEAIGGPGMPLAGALRAYAARHF